MLRIAVLLSALMFSCFAIAEDEAPPEPGFNEATFKGLQMRGIGPAFMSGRIADIVIHPDNRAVWYVAVGSGGVWKTVNAGTTWTPIFEDQASYSVGCVTLDPNNPNTVWVGSGENHSGRHIGYGDGIYRSLDGGKSWENMGLANSERVGMIRVDPRNSNVVYAAVQGGLWSPGGERGLYKSDDGGKTWNNILAAGEWTGVSEVHMDPRDPDTLYAVTWQRARSVAALMDGGPETGIHKSTDGGATWRELSNGLPEEDMGKLGLAISPQRPDVLYATIELAQRTGAFYRSTDGGESWEKRSDYAAGGTGPHYYNEIFASPHTFDTVYHADVFLHYTTDGGKTFIKTERADKHVDHHAVAFDPNDPKYMIVGNDGGLYESFDAGTTWRYVANLPLTQFYKVAVDYDTPFYNVYGGTQDNNTQGGPSRTDNVVGIRNSDWYVTLGGDGHQPAVDPTNPDIHYAQWQQGNLNRYDRRTGESVYIQPQPRAGEDNERFNWDAPILISPHDPARLYHASQRVWRSDDRGDSWVPISGDLSKGIDRFQQPIMGRVWSYDSNWDLYAMSKFGTVTSLSESPLVEGLIYAGTDDGQIQITENGGKSWRKIVKLPGVPDDFFVNDIKADLFDENVVYVAVDNHKNGDFRPFLLKSNDRGRSWTSIAKKLPERHLVWRLVQDHVKPELLFVGTEFGVFFSVDGGGDWTKLSGNVPNIPFRDLVIQTRENDLVGATFGRGFYVFDDYSPLRNVTAEMLREQVTLFPVRTTPWYLPKRPLGCWSAGCKASQGAAYFVAPNPPFGAVFTYYLPEEIRALKETRRKTEKELEKSGGDTPMPGWDALLRESLEDSPAMVLTVRDSSGNIVRHVEGPVTAGFHRVAWDLRYPSTNPWSEEEAEAEDEDQPRGYLAAPGRYSVTLSRRVDGELTPVGQAQAFDVMSIREPTLAGADQAERAQWALSVADIGGQVHGSVASIDEALVSVAAIKTALGRATAPPDLFATANRIGKELSTLRQTLAGNEARGYANDPGPVAILDRLGMLDYNQQLNLYGPNKTQRDALAIAQKQYGELQADLERLLERELPALRRQLDDAGAPWTP